MNPSLRNGLIVLLVCVVAVVMGSAIAQADYTAAFVVAVVTLWLVFARIPHVRVEAWLFGLLVFGYIIGNRGFAQIMPIPGLPLLLGEIGLGAGLSLLLLRKAFLRELPLRRETMHLLLLLWLALGCGRMIWDFRVFGLTAVRDFAMVYYLLFFFCAHALGEHGASRHVFRHFLTITMVGQVFAAVAVTMFPEFFLMTLRLHGVPLILQKGDLLALNLFAAFLWLTPKTAVEGRVWWRWILPAIALGYGLLQLSRASMLGLACALVCLWVARRWQTIMAAMGVLVAGALVVGAAALLPTTSVADSRLYATYEAMRSIVDFSGTAVYRSADASNKGDNNRFRLVWWRKVIDETIAVNPWIGLGFGTDLARGFAREYYGAEDPEFSVRSPHNVLVTTFGRMGLAGLATLLAIFACEIACALRSARAARSGEPGSVERVTLHAMCLLVMAAACFGVVLEGPMGAIPFWIILGLAHSRPQEQPENPVHQPPRAELILPVAGDQATANGPTPTSRS